MNATTIRFLAVITLATAGLASQARADVAADVATDADAAAFMQLAAAPEDIDASEPARKPSRALRRASRNLAAGMAGFADILARNDEFPLNGNLIVARK